MKTNKKTIDFFHHSFDINCTPCEGGVIISMGGFRRFEDFYLCVPQKGFFSRAANEFKYGAWKREYFYNGEFLGAGRSDKEDKIRRLCEEGYVQEAKEYMNGYMFWRETTLGGLKINKYKEAARISHQICEKRGKAGHEERKLIRRIILKTL